VQCSTCFAIMSKRVTSCHHCWFETQAAYDSNLYPHFWANFKLEGQSSTSGLITCSY
jgi:hypothetical protein